MLTKDKAKPKAPELVTLEGSGEQAYIRHMTGGERIRLVENGERIDPTLAVMLFLANEDGTRMFADDEREAADAIDGIVFQDVFLAGLILNKLAEGSHEAEVKK